ncbi:MAG: shikimate kinase [Planctomycetaceae bacterium]|nr:shikimate kinase [Planctomycetaceae bacterium]
MIVTLIGYRGSGKSSVAPPLAERLGLPWLDVDLLIEQRAGKSIREIFATDGEPVFRKLERDLIAESLHEDKLILALGGGAILDPQTRAAIRAAGPVVWLKASVDVIADRILGDDATRQRRPDLTGLGGRDEIELLLAQRTPIYQQSATLTLVTDGRTIGELVELIVHAIPQGADG